MPEGSKIYNTDLYNEADEAKVLNTKFSWLTYITLVANDYLYMLHKLQKH